ncbi:hypothetical protein KAR91_51830 [Candidatus Pacearchaeota archaeon]|nr:hypothetical protein [Candidatus Pacearchaeota archaeon]
MAKQKVHTFKIKIRLNKPCSRADALAIAKDNIHGDFYPYAPNDGDPDYGKISSITTGGLK